MSEPLKEDGETSGYKPESVYFRELLEQSAPELLHSLTDDPTFLPVACIKKLRGREDNYVISPILIDLIMMAVRLGSEGETADEIRNSLKHAALERQWLKRTAKALIHVLKEEDLYVFFPVSKIFVGSLHTINRNFKILSEGVFYIIVELLNFREPKKATSKINKFVSYQTLGAVNDTLPIDFLTDSCKVVIGSSVYFTASWNVDINREPTSKKEFTVNPDLVVEAEFMHTLSYYNYYESEELKAKFLELKLIEEQGSLVIILPNEQYSVSYLEDNLADILAMPESKFRREVVKAEMPKYIISTTWDCKDVLQKLGIKKLFTENQAEILGIAGDPGDLHVNHIVQKIIIRVDEQGVETTTIFNGQKNEPSPCGISDSAKEFIGNRPFLFYVKIRGVIAFIGRLMNPSHTDDVRFF